ncbi:MAG: NAD-dependent dehydratase, partial [Ilumatobacteraceae bacterium]|nr:NAD-dependent dehydratase [Ilumatobacteraceae bacterium]
MPHAGQRRTALVVGGTGPTGVPVVAGLLTRGFRVTILHTGRHEDPAVPEHVEHVHCDPFDAAATAAALAGRTFDVGLVMYGRLRALAGVIGPIVGKLITVGGVPSVRGYGDPELLTPAGLPVPTYEDAPVLDAHDDEPLNDKAAKIAETEETVLSVVPSATHYRYPLIYGPRQLLPREWMIVRRILDGRRTIIVPDGGLQLRSAAFVENAAHAVLLAADHPERSAGQIYHVSDSRTPTLRQVVEIVAQALDHDLEIVGMPYALATPAHPLTGLNGSFHRYMPSTKLAAELGYRDVVPVEDALASTARWLDAHRPEPGGEIERALQDPFDYVSEDALLAAWRGAVG